MLIGGGAVRIFSHCQGWARQGWGELMENNIWKYGVRTPGGQEENKLFFWSPSSFFVATKL